ncbi:hypothetical protein JN531_003820 [Flagellatimonas centrodinii]|uniref:hypothetical protein n=1 Tax=Flagellatimonas centrodinii TaxID=2806210 RepID=UPI001FED8994|nr:hypothetical protein [Flagellatimonas centrodinii]ULQ47415.1 hypothetical protein JN531_003820 [Flagellatimonas centrodinii]
MSRTHAQEIAAALTCAQARAVALAFLRSVERLDEHGRPDRFVREQRGAVAMAEHMAVSVEEVCDVPA